MLSLMQWNWQQPDWPHFQWKQKLLQKSEEQFLLGSGVLVGKTAHLDETDSNQLIVELLSNEAMTTSEIEGEVLNRESVQSSIQIQLGLAISKQAPPAEQGIAEMIVDLYTHSYDVLTESTLLDWHSMICKGRTDLQNVGAYRTSASPMQVVSGLLHKPTVHFEAPPSSLIKYEMEQFIEWCEVTGVGGKHELPLITRAGLAHLYFVSIHPFEDGNGRVARGVSEKILSNRTHSPQLSSLSATLLAHRLEYYKMLERANKSNEVSPWLRWFAGIALESQERTQNQIDFIIQKSSLLTSISDAVNARQLKVLLRMCREGSSGFTGGLSAGNYVTIAKTSPATARRDLAELVEMNALTRTGIKRHTRYQLAIPMQKNPRIKIDDSGEIVRGS